MMSKLALQFPAIRHSFLAVFNAFQNHIHKTANDIITEESSPDLKSNAPRISQFGSLTMDKLGNVLDAITQHSRHFTDEEVANLFQVANLDGSKIIRFREFLICVALGYYLKDYLIANPIIVTKNDDGAIKSAEHTVNSANSSNNLGDHSQRVLNADLPENNDGQPSTEVGSDPNPAENPTVISHDNSTEASLLSPASSYGNTDPSSSVDPHAVVDPYFEEVAYGFRVVRDAFDEMDDNHSGSVDTNELKNALFSTRFKSDAHINVLEQRFKELDFNGDGDVEFKEFLYGVVSWVGLMDDVEESDDDFSPLPNEDKNDSEVSS
jgi:Ca2+-binding EF-hand superfamily protein